MIKRIIGFVLILCAVFFLFGACGEQIDRAEDAIEKGMETVRDAAESIGGRMINNSRELISKERAEDIAINHAGLTAEQVSGLRSEYDFEDNVPMYDVEFYHGKTEYDYKINAENGEIVSFDMENR